MIDRRAIFLNAHAIARQTKGRQCIAPSYRASFAIALRQCYANAKAAAERNARMSANIAAMKAKAFADARAAIQARLDAAKERAFSLEMQDRLGIAGLEMFGLMEQLPPRFRRADLEIAAQNK